MSNSAPSGRKPSRDWIRWILAILAALVLLGLAWLSLSTDAKITGLRNVLSYKLVKGLGGPRLLENELLGALAGTVRDVGGKPIAGAVLLVASPLGQTFTAETGSDGSYHIVGVPPGRYMPVAGKRGYDDALSKRCAAGLCRKRTVTVRPGTESQGVDLILSRAEPPAIVVDDSLVVSTTVEVQTSAPFPGKARRTYFTFERAGLRIDDCYLYEPIEGEGPFPTLLLVLPGPVLGWEIVPVPFATQGFSVLACYPLRGTDIDGDAADLLTALEYLRQGRLPFRGDPERLGLIGASYTSLHAYRLLGLTDQVDVALVLGGMADGFAFRHDVETGTAHARAPFDLVLIGLGFPNSSPELYFRYCGTKTTTLLLQACSGRTRPFVLTPLPALPPHPASL